MIQSKKQWLIQQPKQSTVQELSQQLGISTIAAKILIARGYENVETCKSILHMDESSLHDPFLLHGMQDAVERIERALENDEKIRIYGDYDAGATRF